MNIVELGQINLARKINEYCKSQVDDWRRVPYLALMTDGITGWNGTYATAYDMGVWRLESGQKYGYYLTIDLSTGELCNFNRKLDFSNMYDVRDICKLEADELDAKRICDSLEKQSKEEYRSYTNIDKIRENHKRYAHITPTFIRIKPIPQPYYGFD